MKSNIFKGFLLSLTTLLLFTFISCDSDDDLPVVPTIVVNTFCYGLNEGDSFDTENGYYNAQEEIRPSVYKTSAFVTEANITADGNGELQGSGALILLQLYGNIDTFLQTGTYVIQNTDEVGTAGVSYDLEFDSTNTTNRGVSLVSGYISVSTYRGGYFVDIDGQNANGDRIHGIYYGDFTEL